MQDEVWTPNYWKTKFVEMVKEHGFQQSVEAEQDKGTECFSMRNEEVTRVRNYCERHVFQEGGE